MLKTISLSRVQSNNFGGVSEERGEFVNETSINKYLHANNSFYEKKPEIMLINAGNLEKSINVSNNNMEIQNSDLMEKLQAKEDELQAIMQENERNKEIKRKICEENDEYKSQNDDLIKTNEKIMEKIKALENELEKNGMNKN